MGKKYLLEIEENKDGNFAWSNFAPYTEPDMEQVRKEAYDKCMDEAEMLAYKLYSPKIDEAYQRGLNDAWECARKVSQVRKYGGYGDCLEEVFGRHRVPWDVFDYSASECIEKIRQYEQEKDRQARIEYNFDEIKDVLETTAKECNVSLDEIAEVLQKMKES